MHVNRPDRTRYSTALLMSSEPGREIHEWSANSSSGLNSSLRGADGTRTKARTVSSR
jgi:hypothetical protein